MAPLLQLRQVTKLFAGITAVDNVSLELDEGQILCLLGPSGCGKSTLLRLIAGLETLDSGQILFEKQDIAPVPPHQRGFGLMFQEFALFPHKNVGQNVAFGLQQARQAVDVNRQVQAMLALVGLAGFEDRDVNNLSGGERQRVALARSLAPGPRLLMLDEPLGALDRALREHLMLELRRILKKLGLTAIYVTHDQMEALAVADRVAVMNRGHIEQQANPEDLYYFPRTPFVARFLGFTNLLEVTCAGQDRVDTPLGSWSLALPGCTPGQALTLLIRPEAASLSPSPAGFSIQGEIKAVSFRGRFYQVILQAAGQELIFEMPPGQAPPVGATVTLWLDPTAVAVFT